MKVVAETPIGGLNLFLSGAHARSKCACDSEATYLSNHFEFKIQLIRTRPFSNPGAIAGNASAQKSMVHGASYNVETFQENTTNLVCKIKFKVSATNVTNFQLVEDLPSIYNKYLKKTLKIPLKIECHFATSAHAERYVARLVRGWNPFEWVSLSSG